jgi:hypothetical protein
VGKHRESLWKDQELRFNTLLGKVSVESGVYCPAIAAVVVMLFKAKAVSVPKHRYRWARYARTGEGYEVSSHGDKRFSALYARLRDRRTIEEAYQLDVKGYRAIANSWRVGKGKPPLLAMTQDELWEAYLNLWRQWAIENPVLMADLAVNARGKVLSDKFASSVISQARALCLLLNERA